MARVGHTGILTITDRCTRKTMYIPTIDLTAETAARAIHDRYYPEKGWPLFIRSDRAQAFAGSVMQAMAKIFQIFHPKIELKRVFHLYHKIRMSFQE